MITEFAKNLKKVRKHYNLSQTDFANRIKIGRPRYSSWEEARAEPDLKTLIQLCKTYNIKDIIGLVENPQFDFNKQPRINKIIPS